MSFLKNFPKNLSSSNIQNNTLFKEIYTFTNHETNRPLVSNLKQEQQSCNLLFK
jgi:hypothetical protein